jgi:hypothetical protein
MAVGLTEMYVLQNAQAYHVCAYSFFSEKRLIRELELAIYIIWVTGFGFCQSLNKHYYTHWYVWVDVFVMSGERKVVLDF